MGEETNFRDEKNFAVVIAKTGAASLEKAGIDNPAEHFKDKKHPDRQQGCNSPKRREVGANRDGGQSATPRT